VARLNPEKAACRTPGFAAAVVVLGVEAGSPRRNSLRCHLSVSVPDSAAWPGAVAGIYATAHLAALFVNIFPAIGGSFSAGGLPLKIESDLQGRAITRHPRDDESHSKKKRWMKRMILNSPTAVLVDQIKWSLGGAAEVRESSLGHDCRIRASPACAPSASPTSLSQ